jgi:hypothetical protein
MTEKLMICPKKECPWNNSEYELTNFNNPHCYRHYKDSDCDSHFRNCPICVELKDKKEICGAYKEFWKELDKPEGWEGCSLPKGHQGNHSDTYRQVTP